MHIREATVDAAPGIARVHVDTWRAAYAGIVPAEHLAGLSYERSEARWRENLARREAGRFTLIAKVDDNVVSFASAGPEHDGLPGYDGEVYALYVLSAFQRQGIGRTLMLAVVNRLVADGFRAMVIWALKENVKARAFYEALGSVQISEKTIMIGGAELVDVAYGWSDLQRWLARQRDR